MILDLLFPKICLECKKKGVYMCSSCLGKVRFGSIKRPFSLNVYPIWKYEGVIRKAIISIKYKYATDITEELVSHAASLLIKKNSSFFNSKSIYLVPIPMHWRKENERGFNQADLIGERLCQEMNWKFVSDLLIKDVKTPSQVGLKGVKRTQNIIGSFSINKKYKGKLNIKILLFDDVLTTGSTLLEATKVLRKEGFKSINYLTIAG